MKEEITNTHIDFRERVVVFLAFLTSEPCQAACRRHAMPEELAAALARLWFDEIYVPGDSYLDGLKGDRFDDDLDRFRACFTDDERDALARFHGFFELRLDFVSNSALGRAFFPDNDSWRSLVKHAAYLLDDLDPDADRLRTLLAAFVEETLGAGQGGALLEGLRQPRRLKT
jgi:hypothetical protein